MVWSMKFLKALWSAAWKIAVFITLWGILYAPLVIPVANRLGQTEGGSSLLARLYYEITGAITILLVAWVMVRFIDKRSFISLGFAPNHIIQDVLIGLGIGIGMMVVSVAVLWLLGWAAPQAVLGFSGRVLIMTGLAMLINTVTQEVLVRGYPQQTLQSHFGSVPAIILSAILFTALHLGAIKGTLLPAINLFAAGLLLGIAYAVTKNLWLPIALHFGWNFLEGPVLGLAVSGQSVDSGWRVFRLEGPPIFTGGAFGLEGGLVATATTVLGIAALLLLSLPKVNVISPRQV
jgi:uncharacterized protein